MSRYRVHTTPWSVVDSAFDPFLIEATDALDTKTGHVYSWGAYRVVDRETGKPVKRGKGGTVPFYGESAWSAAQRLADDLYWQARQS
jgi:hypothetical protein